MIYEEAEVENFDVRSNLDFVKYITKNGLQDFIRFDNDLELEKTGEVAPDGYAAIKWL